MCVCVVAMKAQLQNRCTAQNDNVDLYTPQEANLGEVKKGVRQ